MHLCWSLTPRGSASKNRRFLITCWGRRISSQNLACDSEALLWTAVTCAPASTVHILSKLSFPPMRYLQFYLTIILSLNLSIGICFVMHNRYTFIKYDNEEHFNNKCDWRYTEWKSNESKSTSGQLLQNLTSCGVNITPNFPESPAHHQQITCIVFYPTVWGH